MFNRVRITEQIQKPYLIFLSGCQILFDQPECCEVVSGGVCFPDDPGKEIAAYLPFEGDLYLVGLGNV